MSHDTPVASAYRKVSVCAWSDLKVRNLSALKPSGQAMFLMLLVGPQTTNIPGVQPVGRMAFAEILGWELEDFDEAFGEALDEGLVEADWKARLVFVPKAIKHNLPQSPNVVKSWAFTWSLVPECELKNKAWNVIYEALSELGQSFAEAFKTACPLAPEQPKRRTQCVEDKPSPKPSEKPTDNQEQEQKQEQKQEEPLSAPPASPPPTKKGDPGNETELQAACRETFKAYQTAYFERYGTAHSDNAKVRSQIKQFVQRIGREESPLVSAWFVGHPASVYVQGLHVVGMLLRDAEKLRTEWATGRHVTATSARQSDRTASNFHASQEAAEILRAKGLMQ